MLGVLIDLALVLGTMAVLYKGSQIAAKVLVDLIRLAAVTAIVAPGARASARAEATLPARDLAFNLTGDKASAKLFNTIVEDRLARTRMAAMHPDMTPIAARIGRRLARRTLSKRVISGVEDVRTSAIICQTA